MSSWWQLLELSHDVLFQVNSRQLLWSSDTRIFHLLVMDIQMSCRGLTMLPGTRIVVPATAAAWWRHQMETFSALLAICAGNSPVVVNSPHKGQWRGALMFSLICVWINGWVNNREASDLRRYRGHHDVNVMGWNVPLSKTWFQYFNWYTGHKRINMIWLSTWCIECLSPWNLHIN